MKSREQISKRIDSLEADALEREERIKLSSNKLYFDLMSADREGIINHIKALSWVMDGDND